MMMYRLLLYFLPIFLLVSCGKTQSGKPTLLKGFFPNVKDSLVVLFSENSPIDTAFIDRNKNFSFNLSLKQAGLYHIKVGQRYQYVYLEPQDSLVMFANVLNFYESLSFSGRGAELNNFLHAHSDNNEKEVSLFKKSVSEPPAQYKQVMDSILKERIKKYDAFLLENANLSQRAKHIAWVASCFSVYKEMEAYPFLYERTNKNSIINLLPESFYSYRKNIEFNDVSLSYYRPYYSYIVMYINNLAFKRYTTKKPYGDINKDEFFHIKKLKIIDSLFKERKIRDNLYRNAAYSYVFNIQHNSQCNCYIEEFEKYNSNNAHKLELDQIFKSTIALQKGSIPPDFQMIDVQGRHTFLSEIVKRKTTIYYFWSVNQRDMSNLIFNRVLQLKELFPNVNFVGISVGQDTTQWCESLPKSSDIEQYHAVDFDDLSRKFLVNNISKCVILGDDTRIISAFENIFSPNLEKILLDQ